MTSKAGSRQEMISAQLVARGITDARVLAAMGAVAREQFVPPGEQPHAYDDNPLPIGQGQTISQPYMVAKMAELCELGGTERVLEIGAGSGYAAAILARLARSVTAVELREALADKARTALASAGVHNVELVVGDGTLGWPAGAPYDAIVVSAGAPSIPAPLVAQLAVGGRLVIPVGDRQEQQLVRVRRTAEGVTVEHLFACQFVELRGAYGW